MPEHDKRNYRRIPARLIANFRKSGEEACSTRDISLGGVFIETHTEFAAGERVEFDLNLPGEQGNNSSRVSIVGTVRWSQKGLPRGIGVEIDQIEVSDLQNLQTYIRKRARESGTLADEDSGEIS